MNSVSKLNSLRRIRVIYRHTLQPKYYPCLRFQRALSYNDRHSLGMNTTSDFNQLCSYSSKHLFDNSWHRPKYVHRFINDVASSNENREFCDEVNVPQDKYELIETFLESHLIPSMKRLNTSTGKHLELELVPYTETPKILIFTEDEESLKYYVKRFKEALKNTTTIDIPKFPYSKDIFKIVLFNNMNSEQSIGGLHNIQNLRKNNNLAHLELVRTDDLHCMIAYARDQNTLKKAVTKLNAYIQEIITNTEILAVPDELVPIFGQVFCGEKGRSMENLAKETQSSLYLLNVDNSLHVVVIGHGTNDALKNAVVKVQERIGEIFTNTQTIQVPETSDWLKARFIGKNGSAMKKLGEETKSSISIYDVNGSIKVYVYAKDSDELKNVVVRVKARIRSLQNVIRMY